MSHPPSQKQRCLSLKSWSSYRSSEVLSSVVKCLYATDKWHQKQNQIHNNFIVNNTWIGNNINKKGPLDYSFFFFFIKCISDNNRHMLHTVSAAPLQPPPSRSVSWTMMVQDAANIKIHCRVLTLKETENIHTHGCTEPWLNKLL